MQLKNSRSRNLLQARVNRKERRRIRRVRKHGRPPTLKNIKELGLMQHGIEWSRDLSQTSVRQRTTTL